MSKAEERMVIGLLGGQKEKEKYMDRCGAGWLESWRPQNGA